MNLSLVYSAALHFLVFLVMFAMMQGAPAKKVKAVYTIDFIGSASQPLRYGTQEEKPAPVPAPEQKNEAEIKAPPAPQASSEIKEPKKEEAKKPAKKEYNSKEQISKKPKKNNKTSAKKEDSKPQPKAEEEKKVTLSKPSILGEVESTNIDPATLHNLTPGGGEDGPKAVRASFTNFPYPWYITQVRNSLWEQWQKRMPKKSAGLSTLVSFNIDKYGAVYSVQIEKSSGNDSYDYAATSAAENSAPYPPLPKDFPKNLLTVTVEFKNEE